MVGGWRHRVVVHHSMVVSGIIVDLVVVVCLVIVEMEVIGQPSGVIVKTVAVGVVVAGPMIATGQHLLMLWIVASFK